MAVGSSSQNKSLLAPSPVSRGSNVSLASCAEAGMSSLQFSEKNCGKISEKNCVSESSLVSITGQHAALSVQITSFSSSLTLVCASSESVSETVDSAEKSPQNTFFPYSKGCGHQPVRNLHPGNNIGKKCPFDTHKSCQSEDTKEEHPSSDMGGVDGLIKLSNEYNSHVAAKRTDNEMQLNHAKKIQLHNDGDIQGIGGSNQEDSNGDIMLADENSDDGTQFAGKDGDVSDEDSDDGTHFAGKDGDVSDEDSDDGTQFAGKDGDVSDEDSDDGIQFASKNGDSSDEDSDDGIQFAGKDDVSDEDSDDGTQFACKDGDVSEEDSDDGIQFASNDGDVSDEDSDDGIQFASKDGDVSDEDSDDGIQLAGKDGDVSDEDSDDGIQFAGKDGDVSDEDSDDGIQFAGDASDSDENSDDGIQFGDEDCDIHVSVDDSDDDNMFGDCDSSDDEVQFSADEILFASKKIDKEDDEVVSFNGTIVEFSCSSSSQSSSSFVHQTTLQSTTVVSSCRPKKGFPKKKKKKHCKVSSYINVDDMDSDDDLGMGISFEIPSSKNSAKRNKSSKKKEEEKQKSQDTIFSDEEMSPETLDANRRWNEFYSSVEVIDNVVLKELFIAQKEIVVSIDIPDPSLCPTRSILKKSPCPSLQIEVFVLSEVKNDGSTDISSDKNPSFPLKGEGADEFDGAARSKPLRVSFNLSPLTLEMDESNVDRKGLWVQHAIDRMRFMEMITMKFKPVLTPILCLEHRQKIRKRFFDECC